MKHYHINFTVNGGSLQEATYDNYEESLLDMMAFSKMLYEEHSETVRNMTFDAAKEITDFGEIEDTIITVGMPAFRLFWRVCGEIGCTTAHLN